MQHNLITSAAGWRKVFAEDGNEESKTPEIGEENVALSTFAGVAFAKYLKEKFMGYTPRILVGTDTRPTGPKIADAVIRGLLSENSAVLFAGVTAAPEIMAAARNHDGFVYISASHNPIGHNGIKFGLNDGGVLPGSENAKIVSIFEKLLGNCNDEQRFLDYARNDTQDGNQNDKIAAAKEIRENVEKKQGPIYSSIYTTLGSTKKLVFDAYERFAINTIGKEKSDPFAMFDTNKIGVVCDFNGSARTLSIDKKLFADKKINFYAINDTPGKIVHAIIPEPENLVYCAAEMERLQKEGKTDAILGYMPDCDGDRGNVVFWDEDEKKAKVLKAQEVFALCVYSELKAAKDKGEKNLAVCVNGPTSMRIEEIATSLGAKVFRAEVGEANVVNLAREKRDEGFSVPILGEGSNGGNITHPAAVRDPINTIFALIRLLKTEKKSLKTILASLPKYTTTGVSEERAILKIKTTDHAKLKSNFQKIFEREMKEIIENNEKRISLFGDFGLKYYKCVSYNGTKTTEDLADFSESGKGGLKVIFYGDDDATAFIWMRGSGTEPVFRVMCDVKGDNKELEAKLLDWEREMILEADKQEES